eukprot:GHVP01032966.1.p1 GENE.GHVP01032966.1~~GHVP01032966.1.p1  ORF type:complete len:730 (+),score=122.83 GHVP01032966.1:3536-5725(+)
MLLLPTPTWCHVVRNDVKQGAVLLSLDLIKASSGQNVPVYTPTPILRNCQIIVSCRSFSNLVLKHIESNKEPTYKEILRPKMIMSVRRYEEGVHTGRKKTWNWTPNRSKGGINTMWLRRENNIPVSTFLVAELVELDVWLPEDLIFDPHLNITLTGENDEFIGELNIPLVGYLPWVDGDNAIAQKRIKAHAEFDELSMSKIKQMMETIEEMTKSKGKTELKRLQLKLSGNLDQEEDKDDNENEDSNDENSWLLPNGVPRQLVESYDSIDKIQLRKLQVQQDMAGLNVWIPPRFVLGCHGPSVSRRKRKTKRQSVYGSLHNFLRDVFKSKLSEENEAIAFNADNISKLISIPEEAFEIRIYIIRLANFFPDVPVENRKRPYLLLSCSTTEFRSIPLSTNCDDEATIYIKQPFVFRFNFQNSQGVTIYVKNKEKSDESKDPVLGSVFLDMHAKWTSKHWRKLMNKGKVPIEYQSLMSPSGKIAGTLELWVDIMKEDDSKDYPVVDMTEITRREVELRVIIWSARNLMLPNSTSNVDGKLVVTIDSQQYLGAYPATQETDVHFNATNGNCQFNYRMVFPNISLPCRSLVLQVASYSYRSIGAALFIGAVNMNLRKHVEAVGAEVSSKEYDVEVDLKSQEFKGQIMGKVQISIQILTQTEANSKKVGLGRSAPNENPTLNMPPEGRSWKDFMAGSRSEKKISGLWESLRFWGVFLLPVLSGLLLFFYPALYFQ